MKYKIKSYTEFINEKIKTTVETLVNALTNTVSGWKSNKKMTSKQINNGYCMDFAADVIDKLGYEDNNLHRVYSEFLYDYDDLGFNEDNQIFDDENLYRWNKVSVNKYGGLPNIKNIEDYEPDTHVWIYHNGKHYDAENIDGVDRWFDLNFFKRDISKFKKSQ